MDYQTTFTCNGLSHYSHLLWAITKHSHIDNLTDGIYERLRITPHKLPIYPINYYKISDVQTLDDLFKKLIYLFRCKTLTKSSNYHV